VTLRGKCGWVAVEGRDSALRGADRSFTILCFVREPASAEDVYKLWACLEQGVCPALQELDLGQIPCSGATAARCLREGLPGCPDLRRLKLHLGGVSTVVALAAALEQGLYPKLETLSIKARSEDVDGGEVVAAVLRAFPRP
jgi:hypothetical protein